MSKPLGPSRLEALSDGVIAVILTIMVLELKVPTRDIANAAALRAVLPTLLVYLLSFVQVGVYWVNHHYLLDDVEQVSHGILWSNLAFLFCLSLFPFVTKWVAERGVTSFGIALYAAESALPALAWTVLETAIGRLLRVPRVNSGAKQAVSVVLYLGAVAAAFLSPYLALAMLVVVAILWLIPPPKVIEATCRTRASGTPSRSQPRSESR